MRTRRVKFAVGLHRQAAAVLLGQHHVVAVVREDQHGGFADRCLEVIARARVEIRDLAPHGSGGLRFVPRTIRGTTGT
ncbi:hypothetical protein [Candidatus Flexifilum breve]|uniref:hypothetical protein n=1 Tax=Candidatus Flexifilum breve TaxID=3140694 RepID=UPI0031CC96D8